MSEVYHAGIRFLQERHLSESYLILNAGKENA